MSYIILIKINAKYNNKMLLYHGSWHVINHITRNLPWMHEYMKNNKG